MTIDIAVVPPRLVAPGGPVTRALAVMLDADPDRAEVRALRRAIAMRIEADIALLDALDGDADFEPSLGSIGGMCCADVMPQTMWALGGCLDLESGDDNGIADDGGMQEQSRLRDELEAA